ncbi:MAG TPA: FAD-dependent oxidoreductase, partial [Phnomibacter sp.]|nr:FAD-dependent oxidoreductase [Phnomibacter sp.]
PNGTNTFELLIVLNEAGTGTPWLWQHGTPGAQIPFRGPQGKFVLPQDLDTDIYLICTGTGIAPFRSMVEHIAAHNLPHQDIYLVFGCRKFADTLYGRQMRELQLTLSGFHYLPTYSREAADNHLLLRSGYVHHVYEELINRNNYLHRLNGGTGLKPAKFFLCGWKNMIDEARQRLQSMGFDKKDVHFELYG